MKGETRQSAVAVVMYTVQIMKRYSAAEARARFSRALDSAEAGAAVVIERRGVRFRLSRESAPEATRRRAPLLEIVDPAVERGEWTWSPTPRGLRFAPRRRASKPS